MSCSAPVAIALLLPLPRSGGAKKAEAPLGVTGTPAFEEVCAGDALVPGVKGGADALADKAGEGTPGAGADDGEGLPVPEPLGPLAVPLAGFGVLPAPPPGFSDEPPDVLLLELPDEKDLPTFPAIPRNTIILRTPGRRDLSGSPAKAGFKPILVIMLSICFPVFDMPTINISQGITPGPDGMKPIADTSSFKNTTLNIIIRHILASILTQPLKISSVFLLPPMAKASGDRIVRTTMITYRSPIWKNILIIWKIRTRPTTRHSSQLESPATSNIDSDASGIWIAEGIISISTTVCESPRPMAHTCREASSRNSMITERPISVRGSSPSKPMPEAIVFIA